MIILRKTIKTEKRKKNLHMFQYLQIPDPSYIYYYFSNCYRQPYRVYTVCGDVFALDVWGHHDDVNVSCRYRLCVRVQIDSHIPLNHVILMDNENIVPIIHNPHIGVDTKFIAMFGDWTHNMLNNVCEFFF